MPADLSELDRILANLDSSIEAALSQAAETAAKDAAGRVSGGLAQSLRILRPGPLRRLIVTTAPYAGAVEAGRRGFAVAGVLHFRVNGADVFVRRVGPTRPRPFMAPAAADLEGEAHAAVAAAVGRITR